MHAAYADQAEVQVACVEGLLGGSLILRGPC